MGFQQWSGAQHTLFCREISFVASYAHMGRGVAKKWRVMMKGRGCQESWLRIPPKHYDIIYEQPLTISNSGFWWLSTIGQTIECSPTVVKVHTELCELWSYFGPNMLWIVCIIIFVQTIQRRHLFPDMNVPDNSLLTVSTIQYARLTNTSITGQTWYL